MKNSFRKRIFTCIVLVMIASGPLLSQQFALGVIGGPSRTYFWGRDFGDIHPAINYMAGVTAEYSFTDYFAILAMPCFEVKGNQFEVGFTDEKGNHLGQTTVKNKLNYFTLPVMARAKLGNKAKFLANAGPYFSYLISAHNNLESPAPGFSLRETLKDTDMGVTIGIGAEVPVTPRLLFSFLVSSDIGFYDITDNVLSPGPVKNNSTSLLIGLAYAFGKSDPQK